MVIHHGLREASLVNYGRHDHLPVHTCDQCMPRKHMKVSLPLLAGLLASLICLPCAADVQPHRLISDGAVLQREQPLTLWGRADPGESIRLVLDDRELAEFKADATGRWYYEGDSYQNILADLIVVQLGYV